MTVYITYQDWEGIIRSHSEYVPDLGKNRGEWERYARLLLQDGFWVSKSRLVAPGAILEISFLGAENPN